VAWQDTGIETKPNYNSIDLSEVELEDVSPSDVHVPLLTYFIFLPSVL